MYKKNAGETIYSVQTGRHVFIPEVNQKTTTVS